jgi:hypothetical protein
MSGIFIVDPEFRGRPPREIDTWYPSRGMLLRVLEFLAGRVRDEELVAVLTKLVADSTGYVALSFFSEERAGEIMRVIVDSLLPAVEEWFPGEDAVQNHVAEFVDMVERAQK